MMDCKHFKDCKDFLPVCEDSRIICYNYKPKDPVIYVPEGIEFEDDDLGVLGLRFGNDQDLWWNHYNKFWMVTKFPECKKVKTKLTPIDRKDLKAGDWAYINNHNRIDSYDLKEKVYYKLILDKKRHVCVGEDMNVCVAEYGYDYWWKVEKV